MLNTESMRYVMLIMVTWAFRKGARPVKANEGPACSTLAVPRDRLCLKTNPQILFDISLSQNSSLVRPLGPCGGPTPWTTLWGYARRIRTTHCFLLEPRLAWAIRISEYCNLIITRYEPRPVSCVLSYSVPMAGAVSHNLLAVL